MAAEGAGAPRRRRQPRATAVFADEEEGGAAGPPAGAEGGEEGFGVAGDAVDGAAAAAAEGAGGPANAGGFSYIDHTADVGVEARGRTLAEAFAYAGLGLFNYMTSLSGVEPAERRSISLPPRAGGGEHEPADSTAAADGEAVAVATSDDGACRPDGGNAGGDGGGGGGGGGAGGAGAVRAFGASGASAPLLRVLLYDFLQELLLLYGTEYFIVRRLAVRISSDLALHAECFGERFQRERHAAGTEVKAITKHEMEVVQLDEGGFMCRVLLDI